MYIPGINPSRVVTVLKVFDKFVLDLQMCFTPGIPGGKSSKAMHSVGDVNI